jgi:hypothetical protein
MNTSFLRGLLVAGACASFALLGHAQVITLRATINAAQETPANASPATGSAIMLYDVSANTFDLVVTLSNMANTITNSHIHEGAVGVPGGVVAGLGAESLYTRTGNSLTATFHNIAYGGDKLKLLQGGAYYNVHSSTFPGGEVRGQLIADPKRLYANIDVAQAQATVTGGTTINSKVKGAAVAWFDPATMKVSLRVSLYNFTNTFSNSHFHEAAPGASGSVVMPIGGASAYTSGGGGFYNGSFELTYAGDPIKLLTGGAYFNSHSNLYPAGEARGQVWASSDGLSSRLINVSARGQVGTLDQVLIGGFSVQGPEPVRLLITAKGPSLAAYGLKGVLSDPTLSVYDSAGQLIATNNDVGTPTAGSDLAKAPGVPTNALESALLVVLPPGTYSAIVSGNGGASGIALLEVNEVRAVAGGAIAYGVEGSAEGL